MTYSIKDTCPAFSSDKCPYAEIKEVAQKNAQNISDRCPYFRDYQETHGRGSCPFSDARSMEDIQTKLQTMPPSHAEHGTPAHEQLLKIFGHIHEISARASAELGACPIFSAQCPFKTVCTNGKRLVSELESRGWALSHGEAEEEEGGAPDSSGATPLSVNLKTGTKKSHREAENVHFVRKFLRGQIERETYTQMLAQLYFVYAEMEELLQRHRDDPVYGGLHFPSELSRTASLRADLQYFLGDGWREQIAPSPCAREYMGRLREGAAKNPALLLSHAYTRYFGDLSGGQVLKRKLVKALKLPAGQGTAFYEFEKISSAKQFKNMYRAKMDATRVAPAVADALVDEANVAFLMNMRVFQELDVLAGDAAAVAPLQEALASLRATVVDDGAAKCPFGFTSKPKTAATTSRAAAGGADAQAAPSGWGLGHAVAAAVVIGVASAVVAVPGLLESVLESVLVLEQSLAL